MLTIQWQDQLHELRRLVIHRGEEPSFDRHIATIANDHRLTVSDDNTLPQPGDFWIGTNPRAGWGHADPNQIAWASIVEVPLALQVLRFAALRAEHYPTARFEWQSPYVVRAA